MAAIISDLLFSTNNYQSSTQRTEHLVHSCIQWDNNTVQWCCTALLHSSSYITSYIDCKSIGRNCASPLTLTSLIAAFSSSPWRAGLFPVSFMDRPKSMMTHVPSGLTRILRLFRSLWETAGLYKSLEEGKRRRENKIRGRQKNWANLSFMKYLSQYSTPKNPQIQCTQLVFVVLANEW